MKHIFFYFKGGGEAAVVRLWAFHTATTLSCLQALLQSFGRNWSQEDRTNWTEQHRFCLPRAVHTCCVVLPLRSAPKDAVTQLAVAALQLSREHWKREGRWDGGQDSASLIASALESCSSSYRLRMGVSEGCDDGDNFKAPAPEVQLSLVSCW